MKTALVIDSLLIRDDSIFLLEMILNLFPNSEIYTIAHKQGSILGPIETRPIVSSFLTHRAKDASAFRKNFWILPSAVKAIPLHPSIEKVIIISRGFIHGMNFPPQVERYLYIVDWDLVGQKELGWQRFFAPYVNEWREKALIRYPKIAVSSEALRKRLELPNADVLAPTYRTEEYPFVRDEDHNFVFGHHLLYTHDLSSKEIRLILSSLIAMGEMVRVLGPKIDLESVKKDCPQVEFGGDHCEATNALYSHQAKVIWDLSHSYFPSRAFGAMATGRPVVVRDRDVNREYLLQGVYFVKELSHQNVTDLWKEIEGTYLGFDRKILRRQGLKWNERLFKSRMAKFLNSRETT